MAVRRNISRVLHILSSMYPAGVSAIGVVLLRAGTAMLVLLLLEVAPVRSTAVLVGAWICAIALVLGLLTRVFAVMAAVGALLLWRHAGEVVAPFLVVTALSALALSFLGGGAWSVDAQLFGRRVIELDE